LFTKNGLVSVGTYLHDINDLREGMTVLIGDLEGSKVILDKVSANPKTSNGMSLAFTNSYFTFNIDTTLLLGTPSFILPLVPEGEYAFYVYWGDGSSNYITSHTSPHKEHIYTVGGEYTIKIKGIIKGWNFYDIYFNEGDNRLFTLTRITNWGCFSFANSWGHFGYCVGLQITATDIPDLSEATSLLESFEHCYEIVTVPNMDKWDVSNVTNMRYTFANCIAFNTNINDWDVSNVTDMRGMFNEAHAFNQPLNNWDVSNVTDMRGMFNEAHAFNQPLNNWDVSNVTDMSAMFGVAYAFNQPLISWNTSNVTNMFYMFAYSAFDQDIGAWNISNVTDMRYMFTSGHLSDENYKNLLAGWYSQNVRYGVVFDAGSAQYGGYYASYHRQTLINKGWTITDGGWDGVEW